MFWMWRRVGVGRGAWVAQGHALDVAQTPPLLFFDKDKKNIKKLGVEERYGSRIENWVVDWMGLD